MLIFSRKAKIWQLLTFFSLFQGCTSTPIKTHDIEQCAISPRFQEIVEKEVGTSHAQQVSFGLGIYKISTGNLVCEDHINKDQIVYPASSIKSLIALAVLKKIGSGEIHLEDELAITQPNAAAECYHWDCQIYGPGRKLKVAALLSDMVTVSNNIASNQLIDLVGKPFINESARLMGADSLKINRKLYEDLNPEPENKNRNAATASGMPFSESNRKIL